MIISLNTTDSVVSTLPFAVNIIGGGSNPPSPPDIPLASIDPITTNVPSATNPLTIIPDGKAVVQSGAFSPSYQFTFETSAGSSTITRNANVASNTIGSPNDVTTTQARKGTLSLTTKTPIPYLFSYDLNRNVYVCTWTSTNVQHKVVVLTKDTSQTLPSSVNFTWSAGFSANYALPNTSGVSPNDINDLQVGLLGAAGAGSFQATDVTPFAVGDSVQIADGARFFIVRVAA